MSRGGVGVIFTGNSFVKPKLKRTLVLQHEAAEHQSCLSYPCVIRLHFGQSFFEMLS